MADTQIFVNIDAAKWSRIQAAVKAKTGISIIGNVGHAGAKGIQLGWSYDPQSLTLNTSLFKREFFDPSEQVIDSDLAQLVEGA